MRTICGANQVSSSAIEKNSEAVGPEQSVPSGRFLLAVVGNLFDEMGQMLA